MEQDKGPIPGEPRTVAITGARGFIGRNLLPRVIEQGDTHVRLLSRRSGILVPENRRISVIEGDLQVAKSLEEFLVPECTVVNLAYDARSSRAANLAATRNLIAACVKRRVRRLIHCSTAVVFGRCADTVVNEKSVCAPRTEYGVTKLMIEELLKQEARGAVELIIVRPTAVFGLGGQGLLKLAGQLTTGNRFTNYLRSCLFDRRAMNLVCVDNVAAAIQFLAETPYRLDGETFIVSQDEDPNNNFRFVEQVLFGQLMLSDYALAPVPVPSSALSWILRLRDRDVVDPDRRYDSAKLRDTGFRPVVSLEAGLRAFGAWYLAKCRGEERCNT